MIVLNNLFTFGEVVYLKTDNEQLKRIVCSIRMFPSGELIYILASGKDTSEHYAFEITTERDLTLV